MGLGEGKLHLGVAAEDARAFLTMGWDQLEEELPYIVEAGEKCVEQYGNGGEIRLNRLTRSLRRLPGDIWLVFRSIWLGRGSLDLETLSSGVFNASSEGSGFCEHEKWEKACIVYRIRPK